MATTTEADARAIVEKCYAAFASGDFEALEEFYDEDAIQEWPQSGERLRGRDNIVAVNRNYENPPTPKIANIRAAGDVVIGEVELEYPGAGKYYSVSIMELQNGKVVKQTDYFAQPFEAPEWRKEFVERM